MEKSEFDEKYRELFAWTVRYAASRVGPDRAEDVAMTAWTKAWAAIETLDAPGNFRRWMFGILKNEILLHWRSQARSKIDRSASVEESPAPEISSEDRFWYARGPDIEESRAVRVIGEQLRLLHPQDVLELQLCLWNIHKDLTFRELAVLIGMEDLPKNWTKAKRLQEKVFAAIRTCGYERDDIADRIKYLQSSWGSVVAEANTMMFQIFLEKAALDAQPKKASEQV